MRAIAGARAPSPSADAGIATSGAGRADASPGDAGPTDAGRGLADAPADGARRLGCVGADDPCCEGQRLIGQYQALYTAPGHPVAFRHLVALVPDPVESGHPDYFDSVLEGIEEAVARGDHGISYVRDRHWSPWPGADDAKKALRCWEEQPGVLIYRPSGTDDAGTPATPTNSPATMVLLVGETPTWGLRTPQLKTAFGIVDALPAPPGDHGGAQRAILGPTFSGTAASLSAALRDYALTDAGASSISFSVASGTATSPSVRPALETKEAGAPAPWPSVDYASATPTDGDLLASMLEFLAARGAKRGSDGCNVVLLTESLTTYGSGDKQGDAGHSDGQRACFEELKFPPNLAAIRRAYEGIIAPAASASPSTRAPIEPQAPRAGDDGELSADTPVSHDLALAEVLRDLSRGRVRFVGIMATDARDVVFLAGRIREQLPDIQLFTLGDDIRYLHPTYAPSLNGMLVAHATPPPRGDYWSTSLENEMVRSVFYATRHLLAHEPLKPTTRVSLIGNGALWQIGPDESAAADGDARQVASSVPRMPVSWRFVWGLSGVAFVFVLLLVGSPTLADWAARRGWLDPNRTIGFLRHRGRLWAIVGRCEYRDLAADDRLVTAALLSVCASPPLMMLVSVLARQGDAANPVGSTIAAAAAVLLLASMWIRVPGAKGTATRGAVIVAVTSTLLAFIALGVACGAQREATFNLMSGGSPVVAGLVGLGIFALGLWCWRVRLRFLDTHRFGVPAAETERLFEKMTPPIAQALGDTGPDETGLAETERRLLRVVRSPYEAFPAVPAAIHLLLAASIGVPTIIKPPLTYEPGVRNTLVAIFGCLALLPITGNLSRLIATSITFNRLLRRLARPSLLSAVRRLPQPLARPLDVQLSVSGSDITDLAHPVLALRALSESVPYLEQAHRDCAALLNAELRYEAGVQKAASEPEAPGSSRRAGLVDKLLGLASMLSRSAMRFDEKEQTLVDDFVAALIAVFLPRYVRHFRLFIPSLIVGSVLSILMTSLYYVQPQRLIASLIFLWVAAIVLSVFVVYVALDRDPLISAMSKTDPGTVDGWALLRRVFAWGVVPTASLLAAQYPDFAYWISTIFDSVAKGFR